MLGLASVTFCYFTIYVCKKSYEEYHFYGAFIAIWSFVNTKYCKSLQCATRNLLIFTTIKTKIIAIQIYGLLRNAKK